MKIFKIIFTAVLISFLTNCDESTKVVGVDINYGSYKAKIVDSANRIPIKNVRFLIESANIDIFSDSSGAIILDSIPTGIYIAQITHKDYFSTSAHFSIVRNDTSDQEIQLDFNYEFWASPSEDAICLTFVNSNFIEIDSILSGKIQYRLNVARSYSTELDTIHANPEWPEGDLIIKVPDSALFFGIEPEKLLFHYPPLDSISQRFGIKEIDRRLTGANSISRWMKLSLDSKYNMPIVANEYKKIPAVAEAVANYSGTLPDGYPSALHLHINGETYIFEFYLSGYYYPESKFWEIHVIDDKIVFNSVE